jgi:hypothetical protein
MADLDLRADLDQIAMALDQKGHSKLASIVDICNHDIHTRKATVKRRQPRAAKTKVSASTVSGDIVKQLRWARTELRDIARDFRKAGSMAEARSLLRMAEDLAEDERELVEGPVAEGGEAAEGSEFEIDLDSPVDDSEFDFEGLDDDSAPEGDDGFSVHSDGEIEGISFDELFEMLTRGEEAPASDEGDIASEDEEAPAPVVEDEEEDAPKLDTVEACVKEMRSIARLCRKQGNLRQAAALVRWAVAIEEDMAGESAGLAAPVTPVVLPETDGEPGPVDATNFDIGDEELLDFAMTGELPDLAEIGTEDERDLAVRADEVAEQEAHEGHETPEEEAEEHTTPTQYMEAAATLARTASVLRKHGQKEEANKLLRKASVYKVLAARKGK